MKFQMKSILLLGLGIGLLGACTYQRAPQTAYWQRIDTHSALYLTGPKAQQQLEQEIATCVREVDELVRLRALRETTPPNTHHPYHDALSRSGDLAAFETPKHIRNLHVDHSDYYDFESCMRSKGWERVKAVRYQADARAQQNYKDTQDIRTYGTTGRAAELMRSNRNRSDHNFGGVNR